MVTIHHNLRHDAEHPGAGFLGRARQHLHQAHTRTSVEQGASCFADPLSHLSSRFVISGRHLTVRREKNTDILHKAV